jgi:predicted O-linked N-acetylglucosamine transferase (SPINDLY family)
MNSVSEKLQRAFGRFQAQDLAGAERLCGEILKETPRQPDALHLLGVVRMAGGNASDAVSLISQALEGKPGNAAMTENLGLAHLALRNFATAENLFWDAIRLGESHGLLLMRMGIALASQGKLADAEEALREAVKRSPDDPDVHLNLGNTLAERGNAAEAFASYNKVLALQPGNPAAHFNIGNLHRYAGRLDDAAASYQHVLAVAPDDEESLNNLGLVYEQQGRLEDAAACFKQAIAHGKDRARGRNNLGNVLRAQGRLEDAVACYEQAIADSPSFVDPYVNLGIVRIEQGRHIEADALYRKALLLDPRNFEAHCNLGTLLKSQGQLPEAITHYRRALEAGPKRAIAHVGLAGAYRRVGDLDAAVGCHEEAVKLKPDDADAHFELAETLQLRGELEGAFESYGRALALKADHLPALAGMICVRQHVCDWKGIEELWQRLREAIAHGGSGAIAPVPTLSMPTSPAEQLACARAWAQRELGPLALSRAALGFDFSARGVQKRLRVGYLAWGFHRHAMANRMAQLFEHHDRGRFEVFAYAYGPDDGSATRARLRGASEHFVDVSQESYFAAARRIYGDGIDILVDLTGYTFGARPQILAPRPAPIQVNWLGYPGTMGADWVDYLIADPFIISREQEPFYAERVVRLPDCYQINDRNREISDRVPSRKECGLPEQGLVFCCFNQACTILPETFDRWMRILRGVPGSVLWLAEANPRATENLRRAATERGVAAERLVFASRRDLPEYLAQYRLADLALDTYPYTSHATASDALWMGCPLVTRAGETFASRVAGSILINAGLRELVTQSAADCERKVLELATSPGRLKEIRGRLQASRDTCALFDAPRFVRNLEAVYEHMFGEYLARR